MQKERLTRYATAVASQLLWSARYSTWKNNAHFKKISILASVLEAVAYYTPLSGSCFGNEFVDCDMLSVIITRPLIPISKQLLSSWFKQLKICSFTLYIVHKVEVFFHLPIQTLIHILMDFSSNRSVPTAWHAKSTPFPAIT